MLSVQNTIYESANGSEGIISNPAILEPKNSAVPLLSKSAVMDKMDNQEQHHNNNFDSKLKRKHWSNPPLFPFVLAQSRSLSSITDETLSPSLANPINSLVLAWTLISPSKVHPLLLHQCVHMLIAVNMMTLTALRLLSHMSNPFLPSHGNFLIRLLDKETLAKTQSNSSRNGPDSVSTKSTLKLMTWTTKYLFLMFMEWTLLLTTSHILTNQWLKIHQLYPSLLALVQSQTWFLTSTLEWKNQLLFLHHWLLPPCLVLNLYQKVHTKCLSNFPTCFNENPVMLNHNTNNQRAP